MPGDTNYSDGAVEKATGHGRDHWYALLDGYGDVDHAQRAAKLAASTPELSGWWVQMLTVDYERARGLRVVGETSRGDFQVSCSKTVALDPDTCFERATTTPWLANADWTAGAVWDTDDGTVEVRIVEPGKQLRFWWLDASGKSTVVVDFWPKKDKTQLRIQHGGLPDLAARARFQTRWKEALSVICGP